MISILKYSKILKCWPVTRTLTKLLIWFTKHSVSRLARLQVGIDWSNTLKTLKSVKKAQEKVWCFIICYKLFKNFVKILALFNIENINPAGYDPDPDKTLKSRKKGQRLTIGEREKRSTNRYKYIEFQFEM